MKNAKPGRYCVRAKDAAGNVSKPACIVVPKKRAAAGDPRRSFDADIKLDRSPNVIATPGSTGGLPADQMYTTVRFSVDGKLLKTRTAPPYTLTTLPSGGPHVLTVTGITSDGAANSRVQEGYTK